MKRNPVLAIAVGLALSGCVAVDPVLPPPLELPKRAQESPHGAIGDVKDAPTGTQITQTPRPPPPTRTGTVTPPGLPPSDATEAATITLAFEQIPLPSFIQTVYGATLKKNVQIDPAVVARQDLVTIRTGKPQTPSQVADAARLLLKSYGIAVVDLGNIVRIVPDAANLGYLPEIRRGRALPETPLPLRPVFLLVELQAVRNIDIAQWIKTMFGAKVNLIEDPSRNAVMLNGQSEDVTAALEAIHVLDQPLMRGRHSVRISPVFMSADELSRKLAEILQAEGYSAGPPGSASMPVTWVPVPAINSVVVFAADPAIIDHVSKWATELDKPQSRGAGRNYFTYQVRNSDAQVIAATLERVLGASAAPRPAGTQAAAAPASPSGRVDQSSNTIIFQGTAEDYGQIRGILEMLDKQSRQALIEVTVAEVKLTENVQLGVEWLINKVDIGGIATSYGTLGGLAIGTSGFNYSRIDSAAGKTLLLNALASDNRATILSSPRIVTRNGEAATIQVGQEVPIVTSQQTTPSTGSTGVLQTVQYRNTGVILKVRPVIHSGNQVDIEITQEVSAAQSTTTGVNISPTFGKRQIDTKLTLKEGSTVLLGGLIQDNSSGGDAGIPLLKNIPIVGQLFRTNTYQKDRTELIILITPYIISSDQDAKAVTDAFKNQLGDWVRGQTPATPLGLPLPK